MKQACKVAALGTALTLIGAAEAGHESPVYPSFYPQEIRIETIAPDAAGQALADARIQAYVGEASDGSEGAGKAVRFVESLARYLLVRVNPDAKAAADAGGRCALLRRAVAALAGKESHFFRFHPYPVTPMHADYLHHFDLVSRAGERVDTQPEGDGGVRIRAEGPLAQQLVGPPPAPGGSDAWEARVEAVSLDALLAPHRFAVNGWSGPPWLKQGWFHAWVLLAPELEQAERDRADEMAARLRKGVFADGAERINVERDLLKLLTDLRSDEAGGCRAAVAGYTLRRWHYNADYSNGVENIVFDSHAGFASAIFLRTVKLKDFPWNGWLTLGVPEAPRAAWNPLGGFTDETGRLLWLALGDPALFPEPYGGGWSVNRIGEVTTAAGFDVPEAGKPGGSARP